jgi:hypothetical protein
MTSTASQQEWLLLSVMALAHVTAISSDRDLRTSYTRLVLRRRPARIKNPPSPRASAPTPDIAAMSAPVNARPEPELGVNASPEPAQLAATVIAIEDVSPEVPVATIVSDVLGVVPAGIVTVVEKEPFGSAIAEPKAVDPFSVRFTDSPGSKLTPLTVNVPLSQVADELVVIAMAFGS